MSSLTVSELRSELADRGLPTTGLKKVLFARLQAYEESLDDDDAMSNDGSDGSDPTVMRGPTARRATASYATGTAAMAMPASPLLPRRGDYTPQRCA